ncbi:MULTISPECIES: aldehyde dehydrogenase family protein [Sinorhizobium]|uniref:Betaine-aldehyde dehydrogenase n=1 Tax=Sinorhizobium americanum TaxID=194963 RepID=A0A2S3YQR4_9HYPH|nr:MULTISPECIES: aldehyde dehydrogenase family protein [Sinorhizobium]PDT34721.1 betaine-aldehyde dehydrogenase [Sinorhizobium sp. FG01]PDT49526.1 betaine-aldehyde dehydrogenase [Sinorhizobium sp. NG07B]POH33364.1 betaine-aldehyde dehydrogenase [Sinorhizobium americanum]POH33528.1 betaine-aldehyde dehydrogenase [Sinorhizobium americanum]
MNTITPDLPAFLQARDKSLFIDGGWRDARSDKRIETRNPATGEVIATFADAAKEDVDLAVASARRAFEGEWSRFTPNDRHALIMKVLSVLEKHFEELATIETVDMGAPLARTRSFWNYTDRCLRFFATQTANIGGQTLPSSLPGGMMTMTLRAPVGVVGGILPWNGPLIGQLWVLGPALATGCTVVLKPAQEASLSVLRTAELMTEAGVPRGVINVVTGRGSTAGAMLAEHQDVDRVAFTGSTETGRSIIRASATNIKRLQLELGGKSPDVVFADADLDRAVPGAAMAVFSNSGQVCYAGSRLFVQRSILPEFEERIANFAGTLRLGNGLEPDVALGPLISENQLASVMGYIDSGRQEGARLLAGGTRPGGALEAGSFLNPTVFSSVNNGMRVAREEIFGPVVSIIPFDEEAEALKLANDTPYGLGGGVWTQDIGKAMRMVQGIRAGTIWVNNYGAIDPSVGFGGVKASGYGWKGGAQHVDAFLYQKSVYIGGLN